LDSTVIGRYLDSSIHNTCHGMIIQYTWIFSIGFRLEHRSCRVSVSLTDHLLPRQGESVARKDFSLFVICRHKKQRILDHDEACYGRSSITCPNTSRLSPDLSRRYIPLKTEAELKGSGGRRSLTPYDFGYMQGGNY
jgi:hypothetical protein